ncbi:hypothetical protein COU60_00480 [Candidatus Pacearchaeota archaeon CG10_big_fil_rev_8_21_14_0_10_34_76]|nr:MAG: hypothetical protein COU60_00480 [Candidatus Pacearchaeota archaeon CG10_big_fil_rev_8_21_14_0_10_34_76]
MDLVAFIGDDKENWGQVTGLINRGEWGKIFLIKNQNANTFPYHSKAELISVDSSKKLLELKKEISDKIKGKFSEFDAHLSIASGNGKEHMALISALLSLPVGIRLVAFTKNGVEMIN